MKDKSMSNCAVDFSKSGGNVEPLAVNSCVANDQ